MGRKKAIKNLSISDILKQSEEDAEKSKKLINMFKSEHMKDLAVTMIKEQKENLECVMVYIDEFILWAKWRQEKNEYFGGDAIANEYAILKTKILNQIK